MMTYRRYRLDICSDVVWGGTGVDFLLNPGKEKSVPGHRLDMLQSVELSSQDFNAGCKTKITLQF